MSMLRVESPRPLIDPRIGRLAARDLNAGQPVENTGADAGGLYERGPARPRIEPLIEGSALGLGCSLPLSHGGRGHFWRLSRRQKCGNGFDVRSESTGAVRNQEPEVLQLGEIAPERVLSSLGVQLDHGHAAADRTKMVISEHSGSWPKAGQELEETP